MGTAIKIAWRYFRGKKSAQAINIISWISVSAIAVSSAAMIILFSVFNGLEGTVKGMYSAFYPDIKVSPAKGKFFEVTDQEMQSLRATPGISTVSRTLEDMVLLYANEEQKVATLKGVDQQWFAVSNLDSYMLEGKAQWTDKENFVPAIMGLGVSMSLGVDINNVFSTLTIYHPRQGGALSMATSPETGLNSIKVKPEGIFGMQDEISGQYILVPFDAARYLLETDHKMSALEIKLEPGAKESKVTQALEALLTDRVVVQSRYEQNKTFYMIMRSEKWAVYAILLMVLLIASFNMIGSLSMVVLEKKKDIAILKSMGARGGLIRTVFLSVGLLLALLGCFIGVVIGILVCLGQQHFGWIALPDGFIIESYPVELQMADFALVISTAVGVGFLAAWYPAFKASRQSVFLREE